MKQKIYIKQWLALKPYKNQTLTDSYYLKLSNTLKQILVSKDSVFLSVYLDEPQIDLLACFLTAWFEDMISETNVWNAFTAFHFEHYGKILPFYSTEEYDEGDISVQDISVLIWYFLNTVQDEKFISPYNEFIFDIAANIAFILAKEYEYAPENKLLKTFYTLEKNETDFYTARLLVDTILFKTWLFYPDTGKMLAARESEIIEYHNDENLIHHLQEARDAIIHKTHTRLMNLTGKEWAAKNLGENHKVSNHLLNMSQLIKGYFFYKGQDATDVFIEHIASGKKFKLTKKSFDHSHKLTEPDTIMFMGIVQWREEWWFSGIYFQAPFNADLVLDEKNSLEKRSQVNFLDHKTNDIKTTLELQHQAFLSFNNGSPIAFLPSANIDEYLRNYIEYYNNTLNLTGEEKEQAIKRANADGFFGDKNDKKIDFTEAADSGLVFFNPKSGVEIAIGMNSAFPLTNNPWVDVKNSEDDIYNLFFSEQVSTELALFCIENGKNKLPFFKKGVGKLYLDDIDFLLRFWKKGNYHSRPSITNTSQSR